MCDTPSFLPPLLNLDGEWADILDRLYRVFSRDFKETQTYHRGLKIFYDGKIKDDGQGKEEGFWHVVTKKDENTGERHPDYGRAKRLSWAKPLMESPEISEIKVWQCNTGMGRKRIRTYIWLEKYDYVIILQQNKQTFYWVTAYYVDSNGRRGYLRQKYRERI